MDSRSPGVSQSLKANAGAKKTIDLTSNSGGKPEVIDLDGDEVKKSESVIGGGEDTVRCKICQMVLKNQRELLVNHCKMYHASQIAASRLSKRPLEPSSSAGSSQASSSPSQIGGQAQGGAQGRAGGQPQGGAGQGQGGVQGQTQTRGLLGGLRSSVLVQGQGGHQQ